MAALVDSDERAGWALFDEAKKLHEPDNELARAFRRCFASADGDRVLSHLRDMTVNSALPPTATDAMLRHVEGQRNLVKYIGRMIERGSQ